jgi:hypothetical protein
MRLVFEQDDYDDGDSIVQNRPQQQHLQRNILQRNVVASIAEHSHRLRWKWALKRHHARAPFQQTVVPTLPSHQNQLRLKWKCKAYFTGTVVPALAAHSLKMRLDWALQEAARSWLLETDDDDEYYNFDSIPNENENDDLLASPPAIPTAPTASTKSSTPIKSSTRPRRHRQAITTPTVDCATVWIDGCRRSTRLQPTLGSIYEKGCRRSARLL